MSAMPEGLTEDDRKKWMCSVLLPPPGGDVAREHLATIAALRAKLAETATGADRLRGALGVMLSVHEGEKCYHDHHGLCQTHSLRTNDAGEPECEVAFARAVLAGESRPKGESDGR